MVSYPEARLALCPNKDSVRSKVCMDANRIHHLSVKHFVDSLVSYQPSPSQVAHARCTKALCKCGEGFHDAVPSSMPANHHANARGIRRHDRRVANVQHAACSSPQRMDLDGHHLRADRFVILAPQSPRPRRSADHENRSQQSRRAAVDCPKQIRAFRRWRQ